LSCNPLQDLDSAATNSDGFLGHKDFTLVCGSAQKPSAEKFFGEITRGTMALDTNLSRPELSAIGNQPKNKGRVEVTSGARLEINQKTKGEWK
jgi:hypothetical protein